MVTATCVECDEEIEINDRPRRGLRVICSSCGAQLEVVSANPIELDLPFDDDEWDDDALGADDELELDDVDLDDEDDWDDTDLEDDEDDDDWS